MSASYVERKSVITTQNRRSLTKKLPDRALPCLSSARLAPNEEVEFRMEDMQAPTITVTLTTTAGGDADTLLAPVADDFSGPPPLPAMASAEALSYDPNDLTEADGGATEVLGDEGFETDMEGS